MSIVTNFSGIPYENIEANKRAVHGYCMSFDCTVLLHQLIRYATLSVCIPNITLTLTSANCACSICRPLLPNALASILECNCLPSQILEASLGQR